MFILVISMALLLSVAVQYAAKSILKRFEIIDRSKLLTFTCSDYAHCIFSSLILICLYYSIFSWQCLIFSVILLILIEIDCRCQLLPNELTLGLLWLGLLLNTSHYGWIDLTSAVWGSVDGYLFFYLLNQGLSWRLKKQCLGGGDMKLFAALGAWLGWQALPMIIFSSSIVALSTLLLLALVKQRSLRAPLAFGPFLALGAWMNLLMHGRLLT